MDAAAARASSGRSACCSGRGVAVHPAAPTTSHLLSASQEHRRHQHFPASPAAHSQQHQWRETTAAAAAAAAPRGVVAKAASAPAALAVSYLVDREGSEMVSLPELEFYDRDALEHATCPCGSLKAYLACCGHLHDGAWPRHAAELARARFTSHLLGNLQHLEASMHPDSPDHERPQLLAKACHVFQQLQPRLLDMCHGVVPGSDLDGEETHIVALALLVQRDSSQATPHVFIEVDSYKLHDGQWMYHHKEHHMPTFGSFLIFYDKYGPGHSQDAARLLLSSTSSASASPQATASALISAAAAATMERDAAGRYRFDLVSPRHTPTARRTPSLSRAPTPQGHRLPSKPPSRSPTPQPSTSSAAGGSSSGPQARRTPALSRRAPTPSASRGLTPQPRRTPQPHRVASPAPSRSSPRPRRGGYSSSEHHSATITLESDGQHAAARPSRSSASAAASAAHDEHGSEEQQLALAEQSSAALQQWLVDSWPRGESLVYMDDVDGGSGSDGEGMRRPPPTGGDSDEEEEGEGEEGGGGRGARRRLSASEQAQQLTAQQEMIHVLRDMEMGSDSWLFKQSGFRYET